MASSRLFDSRSTVASYLYIPECVPRNPPRSRWNSGRILCSGGHDHVERRRPPPLGRATGGGQLLRFGAYTQTKWRTKSRIPWHLKWVVVPRFRFPFRLVPIRRLNASGLSLVHSPDSRSDLVRLPAQTLPVWDCHDGPPSFTARGGGLGGLSGAAVRTGSSKQVASGLHMESPDLWVQTPPLGSQPSRLSLRLGRLGSLGSTPHLLDINT